MRTSGAKSFLLVCCLIFSLSGVAGSDVSRPSAEKQLLSEAHYKGFVEDHTHKFCPVHYEDVDTPRVTNSSIDSSHLIVFRSLPSPAGYRLAPFTACGDDTGLAGYMRMARDVITASGKVDFDAIESMLNGTAISDGVKQFVLSQGAVFAVAGLGLLAGLVLPVTGCCFCCCRCAGRCGGRLPMAAARQHTRRRCMVFTGILLLSTTILLFGAGALYVMGLRMLRVPDRLTHVANFTVDDVLLYKDEIFDHLDQVAKDDLDFVVDGVSRLVDEAGIHISAPYMAEGGGILSALMGDLQAINTSVADIDGWLQSVATIVTEIHGNYSALSSALTTAGARLQQLYDDCGTSAVPPAACPDLPNATHLPTPYDFTQTPTFGPQQTLVSDVEDADLPTLRSQMHEALEMVPGLVHNSSESTMAGVNDTLRSIADTIQPQLDDLHAQIDNATTSINDLRDGIRDMNDMSMDYIELGNYALMGVSGTVFLVLAATTLGLLHGIAGWRGVQHPLRRNALAHCGRNCLMTSVYMSFVLGAMFFLIGALLFFLGAQLTMLCVPIEDLTILKYLDDYMNSDEYFLGKAMLGNGSIPLTVFKVVTGCRGNEAVYHTLMLSNLLNVSAIVDIEAQMPNMTPIYQSVQDAMSGLEVVPSGALTTLTTLRDTPASPINTTALMADLLSASETLHTGLVAATATLQVAASQVQPHDATYYTAYSSELTDSISSLLNSTFPALDNGVAGLATRVLALETALEEVVTRLNASVGGLSALDAFVQGPGAGRITQGVDDFIVLVLSYASQYVTHLHNRLTRDVGRCHVVYDIYNGVTSTLCRTFLDPFNGFWMSICVVAVFLVANIILGTKVSRYFRRVSHVAQARSRPQRGVIYELQNTVTKVIDRAIRT